MEAVQTSNAVTLHINLNNSAWSYFQSTCMHGSSRSGTKKSTDVCS